MADALLVLNAGSSSLKFSLFAAGPLDLRLHGEIEHIGSAAHFVAHLGAGSSLCALSAGRSIATTMGFTALDGVPMATRCGNLDPGVVLYMLQGLGMSPSEVENVLYNQSGLAGVSGISGDMRDLADSSSPHAKAAIDLYVYRIGREIGSLAAALGGLDTLVFTGGIGEHHPAVRAGICAAAAWLGVEIDAPANASAGPRISAPASRVTAWVVAADEEQVIAQHTVRTLKLH